MAAIVDFAMGRFFSADVLRDDPVAALSAAESLEVVAQENDMAQWLNVAQLAAAWARGRINEPAGGAAQFR